LASDATRSQASTDSSDLPLKGQSPWQVYEQVRALILPYPVGNIHPRFWGYVRGNGSPIGTLAELITATMNTMSSGGHQSSIYVERQILSWLKVLMGFPNDETSSGVLVSGTSVATIIAMAVARKKFHGRVMKIYHSPEVHTCLIRAADLLGIEQENRIVIPTNNKRQIDLKVINYRTEILKFCYY
jgi:aromatic-L-amino-acid decarboxylase